MEWAEIKFEVVTVGTDENFPEWMQVEEVPVFIAREKAMAVKEKLQNAYHALYAHKAVVAADTIVVLNGVVIGKPTDRDDAIKILTSLSGKKHQVITGVVILKDEKEISFSDTTEVEFHPLTQQQIEFYVDKYEPYDKAGAYAIQEWIGVIGIKKIEGDFYNVMGLPVSKVVQQLQVLLS
ncbi:septum formation protein Maf [mine drainage metagenome]|uniref:Septum formation protein Maf n=1 Tax=mine drainage metagenome TaxID=410659 RepID=A0A1J5SXL7_9ZZZZ